MDILERIDTYLELPRDEAYDRYLDEKNLKIFRIILFASVLIFTMAIIVNLADNESFNFSLGLMIANVLILLGARIFYKKLFNIGNIRRYILIFLVFELLMMISMELTYPSDVEEQSEQAGKKSKSELVQKDTMRSGDLKVTVGTQEGTSFVQYIMFFGIMVLIFRLSRTEIIQILAIGVGVSLFAIFFLNSEFTPGESIPNLLIGLLFFVIAFTSERKRRKKFYEQYDFNYRKNYESIRMKKELNYARDIQLSMLPERDAVIGDIEISAISVPANEVGGDYFDYFKVSDKEIGFFICDVSGHGVASGLMLSGLRSSMHLVLEDNTHPKFVLEKLNRMIRKTQSRKMFVTAILAIIDTEKNKCMLFNAGHLPPYKISGESKEIFKIKKHGVALGAMNKIDSSGSDNEVVFDFKKGDKLIFYTDGVNEAMNNHKSEYGLDNLELYLNNNSDKTANQLLNGLIEDVRKFTNNSVQRDDLTLLIIQRN